MPAVLSKVDKHARFSPAARNRIIGMRLAGAKREDIRDKIRKTDGSKGNLRAIDNVLEHFHEDPDWDCSDSASGGRPRDLTAREGVVYLIHAM